MRPSIVVHEEELDSLIVLSFGESDEGWVVVEVCEGSFLGIGGWFEEETESAG